MRKCNHNRYYKKELELRRMGVGGDMKYRLINSGLHVVKNFKVLLLI
jgi:hypothetical protein